MHELIAQPKMLLVVIVYLLALVGTGAYFAKKAAVKKEGKEDFFLAGRGLGKIVAIGTILATYTGGGTVAAAMKKIKKQVITAAFSLTFSH